MIPMLRVFSSENCLGISLCLIPGRGQKKGPACGPPTRCIGCPAKSYVLVDSKGEMR
jgi:hypothetical protein